MSPAKHKILFACSEITPLLKTGGLADVCASLPQALQAAGTQVRIVMPGYKAVLEQLGDIKFLCTLDLPLGAVAVCQCRFDTHELLLICHPSFSNRPGNPYMSDNDQEWPDNPLRFALFSQAVSKLSLEHEYLGWQPDVVHCHDWQTGLIPALLSLHPLRPATVFTIHNLAYQGNIRYDDYVDLNLPQALYHPNGLEFWNQASYIKGGIAFADRVNSVSPTYAREIQTEAFGNGMDGLLRSRSSHVSGILNGINAQDWNPATDSSLATNYTFNNVAEGKAGNKKALQTRMGLPQRANVPLFGVVSRLAEQKGIDLIVAAVEASKKPLAFQLVLLGSGDTHLQNRLIKLQKAHPQHVAINIGFDESLSRLVEAGSDAFLMPSRYEPCGLNQMYSLRYGTVPLVTPVGGLADTVINYDGENADANGIVIDGPTVVDLSTGLTQLLNLYKKPTIWRELQRNGMDASYSWEKSATRYQQLYDTAISDARKAAAHKRR